MITKRSVARSILFGALLIAALLAPSSTASAKLKATATVTTTDGKTRLTVNLSSSSTLKSSAKPKSVKVKAGGKTLSLRRVKSTKAAAVKAPKYLSAWQSKSYTGSAATALQGIDGKRVQITIKTKRKTKTLKPKATVISGTGTGGNGGPRFAAPGRELTGEEAFNHLSPYFLNSAFSDCAAGPWPLCMVEQRYIHCPSGHWGYQRTSNTGADIDSGATFQVTGASVHADGSWAVSYHLDTGADYYWEVDTAGIARGTYYWNSVPTESLGPMYWSQPAITWNYTSGACA